MPRALQAQEEAAAIVGHLGAEVVLRELAELLHQHGEVLLLTVVPRGSLVEAFAQLLGHILQL